LIFSEECRAAEELYASPQEIFKYTGEWEAIGYMKIMTTLFLMLTPVIVTAQDTGHTHTGEGTPMMQLDSKAYISMLENPQRDIEQKPDEVIAAMDIKAGETIADIGAGSGYFSFRFAPHVENTGRVYAVDVNTDMILYMNRHIRDKKIRNVITVLSDPEDPLLADNSIDRFFICNTWHHIPNQSHYLEQMGKMLRPGGQIVIIEYFKKQLPVGPPPGMKMARSEVLKQMSDNGFELKEEHSFLPYQYFLVFTVR